MVCVGHGAVDAVTAWRVRDALAAHPLLGGATAQIQIIAGPDLIILEGWTIDEDVRRLAVRLAQRAAGRRPVQVSLQSQHCTLRVTGDYKAKPALPR